MKLVQRFSLAYGAMALLTVLVTLGVMIGGARIVLTNEMQDSEERQLSAFALAAREAYFAHDDVEVLNFIKLNVKDDLVAFTAYVSDKGQHLVLPTDFINTDLTTGDKNLSNGAAVHVLSTPVTAGNEKAGVVAIGYDSHKVDERIKEQVGHWVELGAIAGFSALALAIVLSVFLSRHLTLPLLRIRWGTEQVKAGKLDKLVDVERSDEIGDLARDFNQMVVQLKELEEMKRDFVAGVTHDFGTPLHAIKNAIELLQDQRPGPLTAKQAEYLMLISNNTIQLTAFINNLLTTASIEAAKVEPFYEIFDVTALVQEVVDLYQPFAQNKGLMLRLEPSPPLEIALDLTMMRQIVTNLVSNAMKYTVKGGAVINLSQLGDFFVLSVADTGIGIDPQYHEVIFDKFYRVRQPKSFGIQEGSGLGLSIVKGLVEVMQGTITVESRPEGGTVFTVRLPNKELPTGASR